MAENLYEMFSGRLNYGFYDAAGGCWRHFCDRIEKGKKEGK